MLFSFRWVRGEMVYYLPILGALGLATSTLLEKLVLRKKKVDVKLYHVASFFAVVIAMIPFIWFFWKFDSAALQAGNLLIFALVVLFSIAANLFVFYSLKWEKISNIEPARILEPLFVILLAVVFSFFVEGLYETNSRILIAALIAAAALIFSHIKKHHLKFNKYFIAAILGSFFYAVELILSRLILDFYSPLSFYFLRCSVIFLLSLIIFRPKFKKLNTKVRWIILATGAIWAFYRVMVYYGYLYIGVVFTTLLVMLGPIFVYLFARVFLKEKLEWRNIVASIVIIGAILYALLG